MKHSLLATLLLSISALSFAQSANTSITPITPTSVVNPSTYSQFTLTNFGVGRDETGTMTAFNKEGTHYNFIASTYEKHAFIDAFRAQADVYFRATTNLAQEAAAAVGAYNNAKYMENNKEALGARTVITALTTTVNNAITHGNTALSNERDALITDAKSKNVILTKDDFTVVADSYTWSTDEQGNVSFNYGE